MRIVLLHFHTEYFVKSGTIPRERPCQPCQSHNQQQDKGIHTTRYMQVVPKALPSFVCRYLQTILQYLPCSRPPNDNTRYKYKYKHQCTDTHNQLTHKNTTIRFHAIQQPTMHPEHESKERRPFILPFYLTRILVYVNRGTAGFGQVYLVSTFRIRRNSDTRHGNTIRQSFRHPSR